MRFHVERSELDQIVKDLRTLEGRVVTASGTIAGNAADAIEWLREELATWQDRYEHEHQEHEATAAALEALEKERSPF
jgi:hypothetical protein